MNSHKLMEAGGCLFYFSAGPSLNFLFLRVILWSLNYWPAESGSSTNWGAFKNREFYYVTLLFKISERSPVYIFLSIVIVVLVNVKTFGKQFVLSRSRRNADSTRSLQGWRRGKKIEQLSVRTVSCEKVAASLNLLHLSRDLPFIHLLLLLRLREWNFCEIRSTRENNLMDWNVTIIVHP